MTAQILDGKATATAIKEELTQRVARLVDGGHELHENYRAMAIANGVAPDDPVLGACRD